MTAAAKIIEDRRRALEFELERVEVEARHGERPFSEMPADVQRRWRAAFDKLEQMPL